MIHGFTNNWTFKITTSFLQGHTANQSNRETMMSMNQIAEETNESHVKRKLSSQKWPSLSVGLFKGNFILIFSLTCFAGTIAQNAFPMEFSSNPTTNVKPGTPVNLKCSFKLVKGDFDNILFKLGAAQLYDYKSQGSFDGLQHGNYLSTDPKKDSVFWLTTNPSFCSDSTPKREYVCWIQNAAKEFTEDKVEVSYQGPSLEVKVNDAVLPPTDYSMSLEHCQIDKDVEIKIVAKNLLNAASMKLSIGEKTLPSKVTPKDDDTLCIYEGELIATYRFRESGEYEFKYSGPPSDVTIKVTVKDKYSGLGLWISLIIMIIIVVILDIVSCVCSFLFCKYEFNSRCQKFKKRFAIFVAVVKTICAIAAISVATYAIVKYHQ